MSLNDSLETLKKVIDYIPQEEWEIVEKHVTVQTHFGTPIADVPNLNIARYIQALQPTMVRKLLEKLTKKQRRQSFVVSRSPNVYLIGYDDGWLEWSVDIKKAIRFADSDSANMMVSKSGIDYKVLPYRSK